MYGTKKDKPADAVRYFVPAASSETEFTEKRSRFISHIWHVEREEEARAHIGETKGKYHDARHNCWCYILHEGGILRYSDDGEPQGTAGQPMLEVFRRAGVENVCCVVTRYFGGILLGAGGLTRAYARSAADGLDAAGISIMCRWVSVLTTCPYGLYERVRQEIEAAGGIPDGVEYADEVRVQALVPEEYADTFRMRVTEFSAGGIVPQITGEVFRAARWNKS